MKKKLLIVTILTLTFLLCACGGGKYNWEDIYLKSYLPQPASEYGEVYENSLEELGLNVRQTSYEDYEAYIDDCIRKGIEIDSSKTTDEYEAFSKDGGRLLVEYDEDNSIMEISFELLVNEEVLWSNMKLGNLLPTPISTVGSIINNNSSRCEIYLGNIKHSDYEAYLKACVEKGYTIDTIKQGNSYFGKDKFDRELTLEYYGCDVMYIEIHEPQYDVKLTVNYLDNETDETHDVGILVDDSYEGAQCIGEKEIYELSLGKGKHTIHIRSDEYDNVSEFLDFEVAGDMDLEMEVSSDGKKLSARFVDDSEEQIETDSSDTSYEESVSDNNYETYDSYDTNDSHNSYDYSEKYDTNDIYGYDPNDPYASKYDDDGDGKISEEDFADALGDAFEDYSYLFE